MSLTLQGALTMCHRAGPASILFVCGGIGLITLGYHGCDRTLVVESKVYQTFQNQSMPQEDNTTAIKDERYDAQRVESKWFERWQQDQSLYAAEPNSSKPKYYVLEMLPILRARCTWDTCATIRLATRWRDTCG